MFKLSKNKTTSVTACASGILIPIDQVKDDVFAKKALGDGFGIEPNQPNVYAPVEGKVFSIFPTKHAISILSKTGLEVLVHMGIDTVELEGEGFHIHVQEGDRIDANTLLATLDLEYIKKEGKQTTIIVAFTNYKGEPFTFPLGMHEAKEIIGMIS